MLDNNLIQSTSSWPFVEIRKLLKDRKDLIKSKNKIIFQTGIPSRSLSLNKFDFKPSSKSWLLYAISSEIDAI